MTGSNTHYKFDLYHHPWQFNTYKKEEFFLQNSFLPDLLFPRRRNGRSAALLTCCQRDGFPPCLSDMICLEPHAVINLRKSRAVQVSFLLQLAPACKFFITFKIETVSKAIYAKLYLLSLALTPSRSQLAGNCKRLSS